MTNKEISRAIVKKLKDNNINRKDFSIKTSYCGYSSSVHITVKNIKVDLLEVEKLANTYQEIDRDERTGEILEGGNTYIFVEYDYIMLKDERDKYIDQANQIILDADKVNYDNKIATFKNDTNLFYNKYSNQLYIMDDTNKTYKRHVAYNNYDIARGLAIFNAIGKF